MRLGPKLAIALAAVVVALAAVEGLLRLQQALGPVYDLELHDIGSVPSEDLNHVHSPREDWQLVGNETYGSFAGWRYTVRYDDHGVRLDRFRAEPADPDAPRVLLLGDSFVEGYDDDNTLAAAVWRTLQERGRPARVFNAGVSSYSPLIYTVQAKRLVPAVDPQLVVVVLDATDLGDDVLRYRPLAVRDAAGELVAVRSSPAHRAFAAGFLDLKRNPPPTYLQRFLRRVYLARFSATTAAGRTGLNEIDPLQFARDTAPDAARRHAAAIAELEANLDELVRVLIDLAGGPRWVLLVSHPHLEHLVPDENGRTWNRFVGAAARRVATRYDVGYFDAAPGIAAAFADDPRAAYWRGDMHFNFSGLAAYGELLGAEIARRLERLAAIDADAG